MPCTDGSAASRRRVIVRRLADLRGVHARATCVATDRQGLVRGIHVGNIRLHGSVLRDCRSPGGSEFQASRNAADMSSVSSRGNRRVRARSGQVRTTLRARRRIFSASAFCSS